MCPCNKVETNVTTVSDFWKAESEHQDYLERIPHGDNCRFPRPDWVHLDRGWSQQFGKTPPLSQATRRSSSKETTTSHPPRLTRACSRQAHARLSVRSKAPRNTSTFALVVRSTRTRPGPTPSQIRLRRPSEVTSLSGRECTLRSGSPDQPVSAPCHRAEDAQHCRGGDAVHEPQAGRTPYPGVTVQGHSIERHLCSQPGVRWAGELSWGARTRLSAKPLHADLPATSTSL